MTKEQWGIRVPLQNGEFVRRSAIDNGILDRTLKPIAEEKYLIIPIIHPIDGAIKFTFIEMPTIETPPRHEQIGGLIILQEDDKILANKILNSKKSVHTVLYPTSPVSGEYRTKTFKVLAGIPTTKTLYHEFGRKLQIDISKAYFSARLATERQRIASQVQSYELVLDMFAGVGSFPIIIGNRSKLTIANDINPIAIELMQTNIKLNHLTNVVPILGNAKNLEKILYPLKFDRIIMNLPMNASEFLTTIHNLTKQNTIIHLYSLVESKNENISLIKSEFPNSHILERKIRSYSPTSWHTVYDIK
ncbi:MAG TPA: 50S ribosomal protein L11 methyltransferase, partial [Methanocorpusculum sp.]|nr:50S ribosomal protein L11 methyltransferase [Methanocorpusculum sp.]